MCVTISHAGRSCDHFSLRLCSGTTRGFTCLAIGGGEGLIVSCVYVTICRCQVPTTRVSCGPYHEVGNGQYANGGRRVNIRGVPCNAIGHTLIRQLLVGRCVKLCSTSTNTVKGAFAQRRVYGNMDLATFRAVIVVGTTVRIVGIFTSNFFIGSICVLHCCHFWFAFLLRLNGLRVHSVQFCVKVWRLVSMGPMGFLKVERGVQIARSGLKQRTMVRVMGPINQTRVECSTLNESTHSTRGRRMITLIVRFLGFFHVHRFSTPLPCFLFLLCCVGFSDGFR